MKIAIPAIGLMATICLWACDPPAAPSKPPRSAPQAEETATPRLEPQPALSPRVTSTTQTYPWQQNYDIKDCVANRFPPPPGYERKNIGQGFADWLRHLPLKEQGSPVRYFNGGIKPREVHEAVVDIDVGERDLQQCADAVMRLKAEYHYSKAEYAQIHFNYTSGHRVAFGDWMQGRKPVVQGNSVTFSPQQGTEDASYPNFKRYLQAVFNYAGTASLEKELKPIPIASIQPGDVFIKGGFPGHAVIVVDVVEDAQGQKRFMLAQSYMPAQSIHILKNPNQPTLSPWYGTDFGDSLHTPEWDFDKSALRRF